MKLPSELALDCAYMHERTEWICHLSKSPCPSLPEHCQQNTLHTWGVVGVVVYSDIKLCL